MCVLREQSLTSLDDLDGRPWVVVGDIHLHLDQDPAVGEDLGRFVREISSRDARSLIIFNGDTFDLDRVRGEARGGVGASAAALRLERILDRFASWTAAVVDHLRADGRVLFVAGNHDAELLLAPVRTALMQRLGPDRVNVVDRLCVGERVVEHGHQADPDAAFHPDPQTALAKGRLSAFPLASLISRALLSYIPRFELSGDNHRAPVRVLARVLRDYKLSALGMILRFPIAGIRILWHSVLARLRRDTPNDAEAPMSSPLRLALRLYLDRYFGVALGIPVVLALVFGLLPQWVGWPVGLVAVALAIPPRRKKRYAHRDVRLCRKLAQQHRAQGASLVVLGHIHQAFVEELEPRALYANHGAFSIRVSSDGPAFRSFLRVEPNGTCSLQRFLCCQAPQQSSAIVAGA